MTNFIKLLAFSAVVIPLVSPASAKVVRLNDIRNYKFMGSTNLGKGMSAEDAASCDGISQFTKKPAGKDCKLTTLKGGTQCYTDCTCSTSLFPFSKEECSGPYFAPTGDSCDDTYYEGCKCNANIVEDVSDYKTYFDVTPGKKEAKNRAGDTALTCYAPKEFTCKSGYPLIPIADIDAINPGNGLSATVTPKYEPLVYRAIANLENADLNTSGLKLCAIRVDSYKKDANNNQLAFATAPTAKKCAIVSAATAAKYSPSTSYYYYTGGCKDTGICASVDSSCVLKSSETVISYNKTTGSSTDATCWFVTGCEHKLKDGVFCTRGSTRYTNAFTSVQKFAGAGGVDACYEITGCAFGYEQQFKGSATSPSSNSLLAAAHQSDTTIYTVGYELDASANGSAIVCRKPSGCKTTNASTGAAVCDADTAVDVWKAFIDRMNKHDVCN